MFRNRHGFCWLLGSLGGVAWSSLVLESSRIMSIRQRNARSSWGKAPPSVWNTISVIAVSTIIRIDEISDSQ